MAQKLVKNFCELGFTSRGVKFVSDYEMNHVSAPNIISEICFCDSQQDIDIYNQYSWDKLAHVFCNVLDSNIPKEVNSTKLCWNKDSNGLWWYQTDVDNGYYYNVDNGWCIFDKDGYAYQNKWIDTNGHWYYLKDNCYMAKNETLEINGKREMM